MGVPRISPYLPPKADELPQNRVSWQPRASRAALLIHDMQGYFLRPFARHEAPISLVIPAIAALRKQVAELGIPVFYSAQPGAQSPAQRGLLWDFWGPGIGGDERETAIARELAPGPSDIVLVKHRYSAFHRTDLEEMLHARGRDQLLICGVYAHIGCLATAIEAFSRGIQAFFVADALADFSAADHTMALEYAARRCAVVMTRAAVLSALASQASGTGR